MVSTRRNYNDFNLLIAGSSIYGRYNKISAEKTFNMILSDDWLVPYPGYTQKFSINSGGKGRGIYTSEHFNHMIVVIDNNVYTVNTNLFVTPIGTIDTFSGDVFIEENNNSQIAISDGSDIWIFNYSDNTFQKAVIDFQPGYISFQNGRFISPDTSRAQWRLSAEGSGLSWPNDSGHVGQFQSKPNLCQAAIRFPSQGNLLLLLGTNVGELWYDTGSQLFPYQRSSFVNMDFGTINAASIAANDKMVVWLGQNEKSGVALYASTGGKPEVIATDGISFELDSLRHPEKCSAFMFQQDKHTFYQFTFIEDNKSFVYDFNTSKFFNLSNEYMNYHIARRVAYFNGNYYFISINDGNLYEMSNQLTTYNGATIPRIRVCNTIRYPNNRLFIGNSFTFPVEMGQATGRIDFSVSKNGGEIFSNFVSKNLNPVGKYANRFSYYGLGAANELTMQFRFYTPGHIAVGNGVLGAYQ